MTLYLKHRPLSLEQIVGNDNVVEALKVMLSNRATCPHVFLFHGPTGCGKTTLGRIVARELGCNGSDFREVNSADFRGIDTIREIRKQVQFCAIEGDCRVWLIDELHKMTNEAQNAMLKPLEDTPAHVYFILCTTEPQKLLPTIRSRCSQFQVSPLAERQVLFLLRSVVKVEGETLPRQVYQQIAQDSLGHPRSALQILDQVLRVAPDKRLAVAERAAEEQSQSIELCRVLLKRGGWKPVASILSGLQDQDPESIRRHVLGYCQSVLLKGENDLAGRVMEEFINPFYNSGWPGLVFACYSVVKGE